MQETKLMILLVHPYMMFLSRLDLASEVWLVKRGIHEFSMVFYYRRFGFDVKIATNL